MTHRFLLSLFFLVLGFLYAAPTKAQENALLGLWMTEDKTGIVEFYQCEGSQYCGRFYWLEKDSADKPSLDFRNADPKLKQRPLCGMTFLGGFTDAGQHHYEDGWIYSPRHGSMFSAQIDLKDHDTLQLRGFVFMPLLGGTQEWKRVDHARKCDLFGK